MVDQFENGFESVSHGSPFEQCEFVLGMFAVNAKENRLRKKLDLRDAGCLATPFRFP
jgi:hypothetical protein